MLLELVGLSALLAASAGGLWWARVRRRGPEGARDEPGSRAPEGLDAPASARSELPFRLGEVVAAEDEERWLTGCIACRDGRRLVLALYVADDGGPPRVLGAEPPPSDLLWLEPREPLPSDAEPPPTLELGRTTYTRTSRRPVEIEVFGKGSPLESGEGILGLYEGGPLDRAVVLATSRGGHVYAGRALSPARVDRMGQGGPA
jgi:hypothetical protein